MLIHKSITLERLNAACEAAFCSTANPGFCIACGADAEGVEPDAERYKCEECGEHAVYGAPEIAMCSVFPVVTVKVN